jgi:DNA-3-methyladenine glycosylase II
MSSNTFFLAPLPPFRLDLTVWTLRRRPDNAVDRWDGQTYRRVLPLPSGPVDVFVTQIGPRETPKLRVAVEGQPLRSPVKVAVSSALHRLLGLTLDLGSFYRFVAREPLLGELAQRFQGMKPPRFASVFEGVINAIACQQFTLTVGIRLLNGLATACGTARSEGNATAHAFPRPEDLATMSPSLLRELKFSQQKGRAMIELARSVSEGSLDLEALDALPDNAALARLQHLRGVGRWTAEYALLRGLGRLHIFPGDDVGARNNLQKWLRLPEPLDYNGVRHTLDRWHPFGGMIYFHLLLDRLEEAGCLQAEPLICFETASDAHAHTKATNSGANGATRKECKL